MTAPSAPPARRHTILKTCAATWQIGRAQVPRVLELRDQVAR